MDLKTYTTGIQHIGIPTNDIEKTIAFYQKLGFEIALQTVNEEADEKVAFLELETLVIETYENKAAKMESGAIDHVAINVKDIEEVYRYIEAEKMNTTKDKILLNQLSSQIQAQMHSYYLKVVRQRQKVFLTTAGIYFESFRQLF